MAVDTVLDKRMRRARIGAMRDRIVIQDRSLSEPISGAVDFDEAFSSAKVRWALVNTTSGKTFFSGASSRDLEITHEIIIRFDSEVDSEMWVLLQNLERLDIVKVESLDSRKRFMKLLCSSRGYTSSEASKT